MLCERCGADVEAGRLVVRRSFAGFSCYGCAEVVRRTEWEARDMAKKNGKKEAGQAAKGRALAKPMGAKKEGSLAAIIDPYLIGRGHLVRDITAEVTKKAGEAAKGRDIEANVRARLVSFKRKGWSVVKDAEKRVKVVQPAA